MRRLRESIVRTWLLGGYVWADRRIRAGDLDFDDKVYRIRAATAELLRLYFEVDPTEANI